MPTDIERVRDAVDLVALISEYVELTPRGREWVGLCPFHSDSRPSMCVVTHHENEFYHCFACQASGSCFQFVQDHLNMSFYDALRFLAERTGTELTNNLNQNDDTQAERKKLEKAIQWASGQFADSLKQDAANNAALQVLHHRGFTTESIEKFNLGVSPDSWDFLASQLRKNPERVNTALLAGLLKEKVRDGTKHVYDTFRNRLMFPICDSFGKTIAFGARRINETDEPKYLNSPDTELFSKSKTLYGFHLARKAMREQKKAIVVEGYTDVIACHQSGVENVVATLGTAFTKDHASMLSRECSEVVLVFDGDESGQQAADRAIEIFFSTPIDVSVCVLPEGQDPADIALNTQDFASLIDNSVDALAFKANRLSEALLDEGTTAGKEQIIRDFISDLSNLGFAQMSNIRKQFVYEHIGKLLSMSLEEVTKLFADIASVRSQALKKDKGVEDSLPAKPALVPKRIKAERELLGLMLFNPADAFAVLDEMSRNIEVADFEDSPSCQIAQLILPKLKTNDSYAMPEVLEKFSDNAETRSVASLAYFDGERIFKSENGGKLSIRESLEALFGIIDNKAMQQEIHEIKQVNNPEDKMEAAQLALNEIRKQKNLKTTG